MQRTITLFFGLLLIPSLAIYATDEFPVATDNFSQNTPMVVFDGEDYFTVYIDRRGNQYSFYGRFISPGGDVGPEQLTVPQHPVMSIMPGLAMGGDNFLYTWSRQRDAWDWDRDGMARILNPDGTPASGNIQVNGPEAQHSPAFMRVAYADGHYLVIWQDGLPGQGARIMGQFVCATDYNLVGTNFVIRPDALGQGVSQIYPDILFDGNHYLVVWDDDRSVERSIYGMFLDTDGHPAGDDFTISDNPDRQMLVRVAYNGQHFMAVWADRRHGSKSGVFGQMFDHEGELVGDEISISPLQNNEERSWPKIGSNGNQFLVAWDQQNLTKSHGEIDYWQPIRDKAAGAKTPRSVVWYEVHGRVINADGSHYTDEIPIGVADYHQQSPEIAGQDDQFLVLWQDSRVNNQYSNVYGRFIEAVPPLELPEPGNLEATFTGEVVALHWDEPAFDSNITFQHYNVYKDGGLLATDIEEPYYEDGTFAEDTTYAYYVTAVYDAGESEPSNTASVDIPVLHVEVTFIVTQPEAMESSPIEGAMIWLEGYGEGHTNEQGMAFFEGVGTNQELAYEVSHDLYFTESGTALVEEQDVEIEVVMTMDDTSTEHIDASEMVRLLPNPATDMVRVESDSGIRSVSVIDIRGATYYEAIEGGSQNVKIPVSDLPAGVYVVRIEVENGQVITRRLIKN